MVLGMRSQKLLFFRNTGVIKRTGLALLLTIGICGCTTELRLRAWSSPETANLDGLIQAYIDPDKVAACQEEQCTFPLHYFVGGNKFFKSRKTILYIAGGPGAVVNPNSDHRDLALLEALDLYNVVYFDIRGAGRSQFPPSNDYDKYLRAKYIARDIETLRQSLGIEFWDTVYAHSFGTIVAQQYTYMYGKKTEQNRSPRVLKLILSAPLARQVEFEDERSAKRISNLNSTYSYYRRDCSCRAEQVPLNSNSSNSGDGNPPIIKFKNFCFIPSTQIEIITTRLTDIMKNLEDEYGSLRMVSEHYQELIGTSFAETYPFPRDFFSALTVLENYGPPKDLATFLLRVPPNLPKQQKEEMEKSITESVEQFNKTIFDAAFVLGYFASTNYLKIQKLREACHGEPTCLAQTKDALDGIREVKFARFPIDFLDPNTPPCLGFTQQNIHDYVKPALQSLTMSDSELSLRAYYVFGLYDGLSGWLPKQTGTHLEDGQAIPCVPAEAITKVARNAPNLVVRSHLERIGISINEFVCPWNPNGYKHSVPTLILRGGADPVTEGQQAEYFFQNGFTGDRMLIELSQTGHNVTPILDEQTILALVLKSFIDNRSIDEMLKDPGANICGHNSYYTVKQVITSGGEGCPAQ
jgi:hypothetical protein